MNYLNIYNSIVNNKSQRTGYTENHHIIPKSLGGTDDKENIIALSAREHFICHYLLCKIYEKGSAEYQKMLFAFNTMNRSHKHNRYINSRLFEALRKEFRDSISEFNSGKPFSDEHREKISKSLSGRKLSPEAIAKRTETRRKNGNYSQSQETKEKIREKRTGVPRSQETKEKISQKNKGRIPWNKGKTK